MTFELKDDRVVAYFSMEVALDAAVPTYSGGLGVLAGDTIKAAADMKVPMVAVTLLHRKGYFYQKLDDTGWQTEEPVHWAIDDYLAEMQVEAEVSIEGRSVWVRAWRYDVQGTGGFVIPVFFLDTDLSMNAEWDRHITDCLYGGDRYYRMCQEIVLGVGGVRLLKELGYKSLQRFHMNEGHSSFLALELLTEEKSSAFTAQDIESVRKQCVFTTHTPVAAGHDQFELDMVKKAFGNADFFDRHEVFCCEGAVNMTYLALNLSHYVNGVAKRHGEISRLMFAKYPIDAITNGVHVGTWASDALCELFDEYLAGWRDDNFNLRYALKIPGDALWKAHMQAKSTLIAYCNRTANAGFDEDVMTLGFARRATAYKRPCLLFSDRERLQSIAGKEGPVQIVYAGKAHPHDVAGKELIKEVFSIRKKLGKDIRLVYLPNYDMEIARMVVSGVDVWLNTPEPPLEASGTSGMKAAVNAVPSLSILDGWWIEGCIEGVTGWSIGSSEKENVGADEGTRMDAALLYSKLEEIVLPTFHRDREKFIEIMKHALALNGSFFSAQRMLQQYAQKAYLA